jgi:hypothetical protein
MKTMEEGIHEYLHYLISNKHSVQYILEIDGMISILSGSGLLIVTEINDMQLMCKYDESFVTFSGVPVIGKSGNIMDEKLTSGYRISL